MIVEKIHETLSCEKVVLFFSTITIYMNKKNTQNLLKVQIIFLFF